MKLEVNERRFSCGARPVCAPAARPGREMYCWTQEKVDFMTAASQRSDYHAQLADWIAPKLAGAESICDAGCGTGALSVELAKRFVLVTAIDCEVLPLEALQTELAAQKISNIRVLNEDLHSFIPEQQFDAMVFCQFGGLRDCLRIARRCCRGRTAILKRTHGDGQLHEALVALGIPFSDEERVLALDQPVRSIAEARQYAALYQMEFSEAQLRSTGDAEYPYVLPREKRLCLLALNAADIPELEDAAVRFQRGIS